MSRSCSVNLLPWASMSWRRGATLSPMSSSNMRLASAASSILRRRKVRDSGFIVVAHSCSGIISPRPCSSGSSEGCCVFCASLLQIHTTTPDSHHNLEPSSSGSNIRSVWLPNGCSAITSLRHCSVHDEQGCLAVDTSDPAATGTKPMGCSAEDNPDKLRPCRLHARTDTLQWTASESAATHLCSACWASAGSQKGTSGLGSD